ncbi:glycosyltransferase family 4 protein [Marinoscillum furvescens]|uniref:Glycosyltransferase involved in cell wall biosynthesis n=1 Tax=Marinoscillum furvescens DSM 4134 TaxID=1122208 RepID=A0A3D9L3Y3_MARFU|nr:glycosyltransferase family 1 protein [Marinoscillum furvescens]RED98003.1 glycosyltransferase involved in cell wall biosynthesis [Marinoscillum furvescens DSM 4134]
MAKLKVAYFLDVMTEDLDGVSITMHQIIKRLPQGNIEPIFITPQPPEQTLPYPVYKCPSWQIPFGSKDYRYARPKKMKNLDKILDEFSPDLLHFSSPSELGKYAIHYAKANGLPVTTIYHTHYPSFAQYYLRFVPGINAITERVMNHLYWLYRSVDKVFAPTPSMKSYLIGKGVNAGKIEIWGRGVDSARFNPGLRDIDFFGASYRSQKKVLFVSRLVKEKEPETLMRLYKLFAQKRPDVTMVVVGGGPMRPKLERAMPKAVFTGKLTGQDLAKAYASSDVFVFPSTTETFGNVVLEAMSSGLPVVAANAGGPGDIIRLSNAGAVVEPRKEQQFFEEIIKLLDDPTYYSKQSNMARNYALSQNWDDLCRDLFEIYRSEIESKNAK